jgi:uncharacterized protein related to proFAR isomerase
MLVRPIGWSAVIVKSETVETDAVLLKFLRQLPHRHKVSVDIEASCIMAQWVFEDPEDCKRFMKLLSR